jgi:hypothetical protein
MRAAMAAELEGSPIPDGNPNQWADRTKNRAQFDYDADAEVERWWMCGGRRAAAHRGARCCCFVRDADDGEEPTMNDSTRRRTFSGSPAFGPLFFVPSFVPSSCSPRPSFHLRGLQFNLKIVYTVSSKFASSTPIVRYMIYTFARFVHIAITVQENICIIQCVYRINICQEKRSERRPVCSSLRIVSCLPPKSFSPNGANGPG